MHRLAALPGGWTPDSEGVIFIDQSPAPLVLLTAADTDIQVVAAALPHLPEGFPALRMVNLLQLQQNLTIDTYAETVLRQARGIVLRLLGGRAYWSYGLEVVKQVVQETGAALFVLPGDDRPDPELISHSTVSLSTVNQLWRYFTEGGVENTVHALQFFADSCLDTAYDPASAVSVPRVGLYPYQAAAQEKTVALPQVGILFYRAHYLAGNTAAIDAICETLIEQQLQPVPLFVSSLRDEEVQAELLSYLQPKGLQSAQTAGVQILLNTTSFSLARLEAETPNVELWQQLDIPVLQVIFSGGDVAAWQTRGLSPRDVAMNIALPEVDGRIISRAVSFKAIQTRHPVLETDVVTYQPIPDRIQFVAKLAANWVQLRQTPIEQKRIALILANYPTRDGRLANGVGLDTPASCIEILQALKKQGYAVDNIPSSGDELIQRLTATVTNDLEGQWRSVNQVLSIGEYQQYFATLPEAVQQPIIERWGAADPKTLSQEILRQENLAAQANKHGFPIAGIQLGNIFVGIQPARGYDLDPSLNYHAPDLEPPHAYLAFYEWLRQHFQADAIVHVGKHGNLEWLPGKSVALSQTCYPEVALGALPHFYPFIVNDPGEGSQAKRRSQAVVLDHLTPPMTRAELYGGLQALENLVDEYYEAQTLDPSRLPLIRERIFALLAQEHLQQELGIEEASLSSEKSDNSCDNLVFNFLDRYLCELKEAQIRDGLHIFGQCPTGRQLRDLIVSIARHPGKGRLGLTRAIAQDWHLAVDPLTADLGSPWSIDQLMDQSMEQINDPALLNSDIVCPPSPPTWRESDPKRRSESKSFLESGFAELSFAKLAFAKLTFAKLQTCRTIGDVVEILETIAAECVDALLASSDLALTIGGATQTELNWINQRLLPALRQTDQEITNLLHGLAGGYVPSGASGAPTRGRPEVLPTGRNFYSVDIRAIPTESAWAVGRKAAAALIEQYAQEQGEYPKTLALSIWGTSTMRTGGDDLAEALALLGVQPVWDGASRRVVDFEILPLSVLGRPRVDVTLRISGFFRDAFPNLIDLFDQAVEAIAALDEPADQNPLAAQVQQEIQTWQAAGLPLEQATERSHYRIFGSKPGAYGAGLQGLIEAQNWSDDQDLARAYLNWSSYAYTRKGNGHSAPEAFEQRLRHLQIVLHNQDNREHDLLDSDDYYQFQGGLTAAVRALTGQNPHTYFGDHSLPENPKVRRLQQEIARVYRSRVVNPKWIAGVMRHGYKGAFEMAATVDYLFAYDATARCVENHMYEGIAQAYLLDASVQEFIQQKNPWAMRDMAERLIEAHQRGLWQQANPTTLEALRSIALQAEGIIETHH